MVRSASNIIPGLYGEPDLLVQGFSSLNPRPRPDCRPAVTALPRLSLLMSFPTPFQSARPSRLPVAALPRAAALAALVLFLGGCSTVQSAFNAINPFAEEPPPPACPYAAALADASEIRAYLPGAPQTPENLRYTAKLELVSQKCFGDERRAETDLEVALSATRGPAWNGGAASETFFYAIVGPQERVTFRRDFTAAIDLSASGSWSDTGRITAVVPAPEDASIRDFAVYVGWKLAAEQIPAALPEKAHGAVDSQGRRVQPMPLQSAPVPDPLMRPREPRQAPRGQR